MCKGDFFKSKFPLFLWMTCFKIAIKIPLPLKWHGLVCSISFGSFVSPLISRMEYGYNDDDSNNDIVQ